jgi:soluble lytic murein transglycosylase
VRRARGLLDEGKAQQAAAALEGLELPALSAHLDALRALSLLKAGRAKEARALAERAVASAAKEPGRLEEKLLTLAGDAASKEGDFAAAAATWQRLLDKKPKDEARVRGELTRALLSAGRDKEALPHIRRLLVEHPAHQDARAYDAWLDDGRVALDEGALNRRLERMLKTARYERAILEARRKKRPAPAPSATAIEREVHLVTALARAQREDEAIAHASHLVATASPPDAWRKVHAWALGKAGRLEESGAAYAALAKATSDVGLQQEACFFAGFSSYEAKDSKEARARLEACAPLLEGSGWAAQARWYRALTFLLEDKPGEATALLEELVRTASGSAEGDKYRYWLARSLEATGKAARATKDLRTLADTAPTTWYGLLARRRLGLEPLAGALVADDALERLAAEGDEAAARARLLFALGFTDAAREVAASRGKGAADMALSQHLGDAHRTWRHGALFFPRPMATSGRLAAAAGWRASYPRPWLSEVLAACERHGTDPALAYAIMRTESGFLPTAESVVGALGLMQLMPYTARGIARIIEREPPTTSELTRPGVSIELGVALLGLSRRELGHVLLAAASYNGGPQHVSGWLRDFGHLEPELFVERIPFKETRDYLKKVLPTMAVYRALGGAPLVLELPDAPLGPPPAKLTWFPPIPADE